MGGAATRALTRRSAAAAAGLLAIALGAAPAGAAVERFAVLVGNNAGDPDEGQLRFAEADAAKLRDVLVDLGDFAPENVALIQGDRADAVRRAVITVNDRIRSLAPGVEAVLLVYYSGHADARSLHLGGSRLAVDELEKLVRGSAAGVRLLLVDACRSGSLTRVKGARRGSGFALALDEKLVSQGAIFLTSSAAGEDAQESDELGGSFFTHYLVSGLLGAADASGDQQVSLDEAYRHAYENTLRASSRTLAGLQHPTFRLELAGRGDVVLTRLAGQAGRRGWLRFPAGRAYLIFARDETGPVVAEVGARDLRRRLSLRPGRYFVRGRGREHLLEGSVTVDIGGDREVDDGALRRIEYARLVRKGLGVVERVHGPALALRARSALANSTRACAGPVLGYRVETEERDLAIRAGWCRSGYRNDAVDARLDEADAEIVIGKVWDLPMLSLGPFVSVGGGLFRQEFSSQRAAPPRWSAMGHLGAGVSLAVDLPAGLHASVELSADSYVFRLREERDRVGASFALRALAGLGWRFAR
jgi:hypothetical protein